jgi:putative DNA primase/helicase
VEGEPCADAGNTTFGDTAIFLTSAQGANNASKTDWSPVRGREIYIWPDADDAGRQYANAVADLASKAGAKLVKILDPIAIAGREVEQGWDIVDAIRECENDAAKLAALRKRLLDAMRNAAEWQRADDTERWHFDFDLRETDDPETSRITVLLSRNDMPVKGTVLETTKFSVFGLVSRERIIEKAIAKLDEKAIELGIDANTLATLQERLKKELARRLEEHALEANLRAASQKKESETPQLVREVKPSPEQVSLADALDSVVELLRRYVVFEHDDDAILVALYIALTYCFDRFKHLPLLVITSAVKRSGKSTLLELAGHLSQRALFATSATAAVLFRAGDRYRPTLLWDEVDNAFTDNGDLKAILNSGASKSAPYVWRCEKLGDAYVERAFNVFYPKVVAGINLEHCLSDTTLDRSIIVKLTRANPAHRLGDASAETQPLARQLCRAIADCQLTVNPDILPAWLSQREADMFLPLLAIAAEAGREWYDRALNAIREHTRRMADEKLDTNERLLRDILAVFERSGRESMTATDIANELNRAEYEWADWRGGKGISPHWLGRRLKALGVAVTRTVNEKLYSVHTIRTVASRLGVIPLYGSEKTSKTSKTSNSSLCQLPDQELASDPAADDGLFDVNAFPEDTYDDTGESGKAGQAGVSERDGESALTNLTNLTNLTFFHGHIETSDAGTASRPGGEGVTEPQLECIKDWQCLEREELDNLVNQLPPGLRKRYWELHSDYRVRHYPYLDARRWAWWELQRELNRRNPRGDS